MRTFQVSDELYEQLKRFVVDPFDDTPTVVIERLIDIVNKARSRWSQFDARTARPGDPSPAERRQEQPSPTPEAQEVIL